MSSPSPHNPSYARCPGRLELICGCMFSGKTSCLISRLSEAAASGQRVIALKHPLDDRYDAVRLATHDGRVLEARPLADVASLARHVSSFDVVGIDEIHFYPVRLVDACRSVAAAGRRVILAGIDFDTWGEPFPIFHALRRHASRVDVCTAPCARCGRPARFSQRKTPLVDGRLVGGSESYEPRCGGCFVPLTARRPA